MLTDCFVKVFLSLHLLQVKLELHNSGLGCVDLCACICNLNFAALPLLQATADVNRIGGGSCTQYTKGLHTTRKGFG